MMEGDAKLHQESVAAFKSIRATAIPIPDGIPCYIAFDCHTGQDAMMLVRFDMDRIDPVTLAIRIAEAIENRFTFYPQDSN